MVDTQLFRDGTPLTLTGPTVSGTTFIYTTQLNSFGRSDSGNYTCTATIQPQPTSTYITGNETLQSDLISIKAGMMLTAWLQCNIISYWYDYYDIITVSSPPLNVRATQSGSSAPVEISWSPPSDGASIVNGYRIYYGSGQNVFIPSITIITSVSLRVDRSYIGQNVSIRSESDQLYSELVNAFVTTGKYNNRTYVWYLYNFCVLLYIVCFAFNPYR